MKSGGSSGPEAGSPFARLQRPPGMVDEVHQQRSCIARIDDFLGIEGFGRPERRADRIELLVKLRLQGFRVFSFGQFLSERRFDPARHGQAAP